MTSKRDRTPEGGGAHRRPRRPVVDDRAGRDGGGRPAPSRWPDPGLAENGTGQAAHTSAVAPGGRARPGTADGRPERRGPERADLPVLAPSGMTGWPSGEEPVARRTATGWRVGDEEVSDLTSAMVLADLLAADLPTEAMPTLPPQADGAAARDGAGAPGGARSGAASEPVDPERLQVTVAQLEHALSARVRVEQAIGVLAERHRLRPRQAFELLRSVARASGRRVMEVATEVVDSATNPLLRIPEELAKPPVARRRGRIHRHAPENS
jgi:hypothetical protein